MTADERIEKLLNHYGQTISDLPKPTVYWDGETTTMAYTSVHREKASETALKWHKADSAPQEWQPDVIKLVCRADYICHLADVIDRMEAALETATNNCRCTLCDKFFDAGKDCCDFRLNDKYLDDREEE